ncbi:MAG: hypothetical protein JWN66_2845 [Sphingomonas bacterium]|nr:hypothetical protein [Sphingomonas bacterium]
MLGEAAQGSSDARLRWNGCGGCRCDLWCLPVLTCLFLHAARRFSNLTIFACAFVCDSARARFLVGRDDVEMDAGFLISARDEFRALARPPARLCGDRARQAVGQQPVRIGRSDMRQSRSWRRWRGRFECGRPIESRKPSFVQAGVCSKLRSEVIGCCRENDGPILLQAVDWLSRTRRPCAGMIGQRLQKHQGDGGRQPLRLPVDWSAQAIGDPRCHSGRHAQCLMDAGEIVEPK